jgi:non-homologous end joining protein Ku
MEPCPGPSRRATFSPNPWRTSCLQISKDRKVRLRTHHSTCGTPISHKRYCELGDEIPFENVTYGYRVDGNTYVAFSRVEIVAARPESSEIKGKIIT